MKPATVRFYIDADVLALAKILVSLRSDVTYPGDPGGVLNRRWRPACPITSPDTDDEILDTRDRPSRMADHHQG